MPIHAPGTKFRNYRILNKKSGKRSVVAILSLTAMVDMFTVLVVFLLQNYNSTGEVLFLPKEVVLPNAESVLELQPSIVVTISQQEVLVDKQSVVSLQQLKSRDKDQLFGLKEAVAGALNGAKEVYEKKLQVQLQKALDVEASKAMNSWSRVTVQADKAVDMLTIKRVLETVLDAGAGQVNFAVNKESGK